MLSRIALLALSLTFSSAFAQPPDTLWTRAYGGSQEEKCQAMVQTNDGGFALAGHSYSYGTGMEDFWLVKTDPSGLPQWTRRFGGANPERCWAVQQTTDGGYILAGFTQSFGAGAKDFWLLKTNATGDSLWSHTYGGLENEWATCVQQTSDGGYVLGGWTQSYGAGDFDMWVVKTNSIGILQWSHTYGGLYQDECHDILELPAGGYLVTGKTQSFGAGDWDFYAVKTVADGTPVWSRTYGGGASDESWAATMMSGGGYALVGQTMSYGSGAKDFWLVRTDADGNQLWHRSFGGFSNEWATSVKETSDGGILLAGWTQTFGAGNIDMWAVKTFPNGDLYWSRTFGGPGFEECQALQEMPDGSYALAGLTTSFGSGNYDFWLVKTGADEPLAVELVSLQAIPQENAIRLEFTTASELNNDHFEIFRSVADAGHFSILTQIESQGNSASAQHYQYVDRDVAVGCMYWYFLADVDALGNRTEHRELMVSASVGEHLIPETYTLQAYPNPFNPATTIQFTLPRSSRARLLICDITGQLVSQLADRQFDAGTHRLAFDGSHLPSGIYLLRLDAIELAMTQKLILLK
jgi:uncharacterized delta-60 repeat protein